MNRILINYATRGRAYWFKQAINNIMTTIGSLDFQILLKADIDDSEMNNDDIRRFISLNPLIKVCWGQSESKVHAINRDMDKADPWDIVVVMSDDMLFIKAGWDVVMLHLIKEIWGYSLDFFAHFNDGYAKDALATMSILGRDYYKRDGYIYHPDYKSFSCDAEAYYVSVMRMRHHYFEDRLFTHQHPANHHMMKNDATYQANSLHTAQDTKIYFERLNRYFDEPHGPGVPIPFAQHLGRTI